MQSKRRSYSDTFYFHLGAVIAPLFSPFIPPLQWLRLSLAERPASSNSHPVYPPKPWRRRNNPRTCQAAAGSAPTSNNYNPINRKEKNNSSKEKTVILPHFRKKGGMQAEQSDRTVKFTRRRRVCKCEEVN